MNNAETYWSKDEFMAYVLIFCMKADFHDEESEVFFIKSEVDQEIYNRILKEFLMDNDFTRIQKIESTFQRLEYDQKGKDELIKEINDLFESDGNVDVLERNTLLGLNKLMKL